jgi:hypothetical protein
MRESSGKVLWGHVEKLEKGTRANYDADKKILTFCFIRNPQTTADQLRKLREELMVGLKDMGYISRMKYNGEVIAENIPNEDVTLTTKNHQLIIQLRNRLVEDKEKEGSEKLT